MTAYPTVLKSDLQLPTAGFMVHVVQLEFSDHLVILISRNGRIGDMVLSQKNTLPSLSDRTSQNIDACTIFGPEKVNDIQLLLFLQFCEFLPDHPIYHKIAEHVKDCYC
uniref:Proteasome assembly chaperone 3 n=1 Tax=Trichobilharzia regenti TaxID=157069 RepID=A0AA85JKP5_TRIRE|nr:unnamed protein product [Trichobilharzia regenti]